MIERPAGVSGRFENLAAAAPCRCNASAPWQPTFFTAIGSAARKKNRVHMHTFNSITRPSTCLLFLIDPLAQLS